MSILNMSQYQNIITVLTFTEKSSIYFTLVGNNDVITFLQTKYTLNIMFIIHKTLSLVEGK